MLLKIWLTSPTSAYSLLRLISRPRPPSLRPIMTRPQKAINEFSFRPCGSKTRQCFCRPVLLPYINQEVYIVSQVFAYARCKVEQITSEMSIITMPCVKYSYKWITDNVKMEFLQIKALTLQSKIAL